MTENITLPCICDAPTFDIDATPNEQCPTCGCDWTYQCPTHEQERARDDDVCVDCGADLRETDGLHDLTAHARQDRRVARALYGHTF